MKLFQVYRKELKNGIDYRVYTESEVIPNPNRRSVHGTRIGDIQASSKDAAILNLKRILRVPNWG